MRLFTAIEIDEVFKKDLTQFKTNNDELIGLKWIKPGNWHITTCFIGEFLPSRINELISNLQGACKSQPCFSLVFDRIDFSPGKKPYMIWAYFKEGEHFTHLCKNISDAARITMPQRSNPIPHLTVARLKKAHYTYRIYPNIDLSNCQISIKSVGLFQSVQTTRGSEYVLLESFNLNDEI